MSETQNRSLGLPISPEMTEMLLGHLRAGFVCFDITRIAYQFVSPNLAAQVGYTPEEMLAWSPIEVAQHLMIDPEDLQRTVRHFRSRKAGDTWTDDWVVRHRLGHRVHFSVSSSILSSDPVTGEATTLGGIVVDGDRSSLSRRRGPATPSFHDVIALDYHAKALMQALDVPYVILATYGPERHIRAMVWHGEEMTQATGQLDETVVSTLSARGVYCTADRGYELLQHDPVLAPYPAKGVLGTDLQDREGNRMGFVLALDSRVREDFVNRASDFETAAARIADDLGVMVASYARVEAEAQLSQVLSALTEGVMLVDQTGQVHWSNIACREILGINPQAFPCLDENGECQWRLFDFDGTPLVNSESPIVRALASRAGFRRVVGRDRPDGAFQWLDVFARPQHFSPTGEVEEVLVTFSDVTEQQDAHDALEAVVEERTRDLVASNQDLETLCYSVSHDLRGPLRSIAAQCRFIEEDTDAATFAVVKPALESIRATSQRMSDLIDQLLAYSRLTRAEMQIECVNLSAMAEAFFKTKRLLDPHRHVTVTISPDLQVMGDRPLLTIAIENLFENAWKYTAKVSHAHIEVDWDGERRAFIVRDNGAGFDPAYAEKLFAPFQRLHSDREFSGIGVGLTIVRRVLERHRGWVTLEGAPGQGATAAFNVGLDLATDVS